MEHPYSISQPPLPLWVEVDWGGEAHPPSLCPVKAQWQEVGIGLRPE